MRVLICGGRDFTDEDLMGKVLQDHFDVDDTVTLIHGNSDGADKMSEKILQRYFRGGFIVERYPANWAIDGKKAGYIRNKRMLEEGKPHYVIAFPGGKGTAMMVRIAKEAGVKVIEV